MVCLFVYNIVLPRHKLLTEVHPFQTQIHHFTVLYVMFQDEPGLVPQQYIRGWKKCYREATGLGYMVYFKEIQHYQTQHGSQFTLLYKLQKYTLCQDHKN